jgi:hypothetical protein
MESEKKQNECPRNRTHKYKILVIIRVTFLKKNSMRKEIDGLS